MLSNPHRTARFTPRSLLTLCLAAALFLGGMLSPLYAQGFETELHASDGAENDWFGQSVAINNDRAIIGAHQDDDNGSGSGSAYIFKWNGSAWVQEAKLIASDAAADDWFGWAVAIDSDRAIIGAIVAGAAGYLLKEFQSQQVLEAVRKAHLGLSLLDPSIARRVLDRVLSAAEEEAESRLTTEEQQILELVSQGRNNREISAITSLTETTVKTRVNTIYGKLEITRKVQSVSYSVQWRESRRTG